MANIEGKPSSGVRDWASFAFSFVAFALSIIAFVAGMRKSDSVELSLAGVIAGFNYDHRTDAFTLSSDLIATFVNSGTRAVAISKILLLVSQKSELSGDDVADCYGSARVLVYKFDPFVVKAQDATVQALTKFTEPKATKDAGDDRLSIEFDDRKLAVHPLLLCLGISFIVPDHVPQVTVMKLLSERWPLKEPMTPSNASGHLYYDKPPLVMFQETNYSLFK
jgi:hypothetical protein